MNTETAVHTTAGGHKIIRVEEPNGDIWFYIEGQPGRRFNSMQEAIDEAEAQEEGEDESMTP